MFPSTGHFKALHCPFHLDGECGRIYCHYRHAKNADERSGENSSFLSMEKQICKELTLDKDAFDTMINEDDEIEHEKLLTRRLKAIFPNCDKLLENLNLPEFSLKDNWDLSVEDAPSEVGTEELKNLEENTFEHVDDTLLDEGPLKQFLEEDAKRNSNPEQTTPNTPNTIEKRHIIISCLEKIEKRSDFIPRRVGTIRPKQFASVENVNLELIKEVPIRVDDTSKNCFSEEISKSQIKEEASDNNSSDEDAAEVDSLLTQMSLLNPQLFNTDKNKETESSYQKLQSDVKPQENDSFDNHTPFSDLPTQPFPGTREFDSRVSGDNQYMSRVNNVAKNMSNPEKVDIKEEIDDICTQVPPSKNNSNVTSLAEQNRVKNLFKNAMCSNIDQFFDLSDACRVYGTEIFNLLEPLFTYLIEKLNPQFNFEKLRQLHSQNISLVDGLPFVCSCKHLKSCMECYNLMLCAVSKNNKKTVEKWTEMCENLNSPTPLRKIEAGLNDITKEIMSLGIPVDDNGTPIPRKNVKHVQCQTNSESGLHSSSRSRSDNRNSSKRKSSKSESKSSSHKKDSEKRHSSKSSSSRHKSSSKSKDEGKKRKKESNSDEDSSCTEESTKHHNKHRKPSESSSSKSRRHSSESRKHKEHYSKSEREYERKNSKSVVNENSQGSVESSDESYHDNDINMPESNSSDNYSDIEQIGEESSVVEIESDSDHETETSNSKISDAFPDILPSSTLKKRVSHVTEDKILPYKKQFIKKNIPSPSEVLFQRMQLKETEKNIAENSSTINTADRVRISHVPNVALLLKAKERLKNDLLHKATTPAPVRTVTQTNQKGRSRISHVSTEIPPPKDVPAHAVNMKPKINSYKANNNIPLPTRQNALDRLYGAFVKKVPPDLASDLALKEENTIHEKVTIVKVYLNSLAMALHRISKEDPAKLVEKTSDFPTEINGHSTYDFLKKHLLTREQLEVNGFPIAIPSQPGCCRISTKAVHYKPITNKRNGDRFYCQQCKELFEICPETELPITPTTGCRFHTLRPRKEPGRLRHELFFPCCNKNITESGCMTSEYHTPDTTDDDCLRGFVETKNAPPGDTGSRQFYSLDCEMCYTTVGSELTRVTVIKHDCSVMYDSLVKPRNKILDYCTKFSGITEEKLRNVRKTLEEVRQELMKFIFKETILIGHSLENDLKALKIIHYKIVDTSVMYPHRDAPERKFSLKYLSSNLVHYLIQESEFGHDSKEDAVACMKLVWKKIKEDAQVHRPRKIIGSPERNKT